MTDNQELKLYVSSGCGPCEQVRAMVEAGKFNREKIDVVDVAQEENFHFIADLNLTRVPTAMKGAETCNLSIEEDILLVECPGDEEYIDA